MVVVVNQLYHVFSYLKGPVFLLLVKVIAIVAKSILLGHLIQSRKHAKVPVTLWLLSVTFLFCNICADISWFIYLTHITRLLPLTNLVTSNVVRLAWIVGVIEHTALALFIDSFASQAGKLLITLRQKFYMLCALGIVASQAVLFILFCKLPANSLVHSYPEALTIKIAYTFCLIVMITSLLLAFHSFRRNQFPRILATQFKVFGLFVVLPLIVLENAAMNPFARIAYDIYLMHAASTLIFAYGAYFFAKRMMRLRFLNARSHISPSVNCYGPTIREVP